MWEWFGVGIPQPSIGKGVFVAGVRIKGMATFGATVPLTVNHWVAGDKFGWQTSTPEHGNRGLR